MPKPQLLIAAIAAVAITSLAANTALATRESAQPIQEVTYQGKSINWWARHAVQARKDANKREFTIKRLRKTLNYSPTIEESIKLATLIYPEFTEHRARCIINHESQWRLYAQNKQGIRWSWNKATGLYQFLITTFRSTPFRNMSIYSPFAQSLAAGWMHHVGRGREWAINC